MMRKAKIRNLTTLFMGVLAMFAVYYPYRGFSWLLNMSFLQPDRWLASPWVDQGAVIEPLTRTTYFAVWLLPLLAGIYSLLAALYLLWFFRQSIFFDDRIARALTHIGGAVVASAVLDNLAASVSPMILSWHNEAGPAVLRFWYDSKAFSLIFCGIGFVMLGWVLKQAILIARENEEFL